MEIHCLLSTLLSARLNREIRHHLSTFLKLAVIPPSCQPIRHHLLIHLASPAPAEPVTHRLISCAHIQKLHQENWKQTREREEKPRYLQIYQLRIVSWLCKIKGRLQGKLVCLSLGRVSVHRKMSKSGKPGRVTRRWQERLKPKCPL